MSGMTRAAAIIAAWLLGLSVAAAAPHGTPAKARPAARSRTASHITVRRASHGARRRAARRRTAPQPSCADNLRQLGAAMRLYLQDWGDCFPPADRWGRVLRPYIRQASVWRCPQQHGVRGPSYAMNRHLAGKSARDETLWPCVLLFESRAGKENASDGGESLCSPGRHGGGAYYLLGDGRVIWTRERPPFLPGAPAAP